MNDGKVMSFLDHLTELRMRLIRCVIALLIGMAVVWIPLYLMYEVSIWIVRVFERRRAAVAPAPA